MTSKRVKGKDLTRARREARWALEGMPLDASLSRDEYDLMVGTATHFDMMLVQRFAKAALRPPMIEAKSETLIASLLDCETSARMRFRILRTRWLSSAIRRSCFSCARWRSCATSSVMRKITSSKVDRRPSAMVSSSSRGPANDTNQIIIAVTSRTVYCILQE